MKFDRVKQAFLDASYLIPLHQSMLLMFQNIFTKDFTDPAEAIWTISNAISFLEISKHYPLYKCKLTIPDQLSAVEINRAGMALKHIRNELHLASKLVTETCNERGDELPMSEAPLFNIPKPDNWLWFGIFVGAFVTYMIGALLR